jgi:thioredoxin-like negative regulator of GroEL
MRIWRVFVLAVLFVLAAAGYASSEDLLIFSADWCGNCQKLKTAIETDPALVGGYNVMVIDADAAPELVAAYKVRAYPTLLILKDNGRIRRKVGFTSAEELRRWLNRHDD